MAGMNALRAAKRKFSSEQNKEGFGDIVPKRVRAAARQGEARFEGRAFPKGLRRDGGV
jgi:hypothetical protein